MRKRRIFDLDLPEDDAGAADPAPDAASGTGPDAAASGTGPDADPDIGPDTGPNTGPNTGRDTGSGAAPARDRRGPMAAAITETGTSLAASAGTLAAIRAENDALAEAHVRARRAGLLAEPVPVDAIDTMKLIRDRARALFDDGSMAELVASIRDVGLSNPIRVEIAPWASPPDGEDPSPRGRFELIQGWRRLNAYRALLAETGDTEAWGTIPAIISEPGEDLALVYRRMVDENLVRKDISFAEMAQLALSYAQDVGASQDPHMTPEKAVGKLFRSAGYQKRSYIRAFLPVVAQLGQILRFPEEIPRALGLALAPRLEADDGSVPSIRAALKDLDNRSVADELAVLRRAAGLAPGEEMDLAPGPDRAAAKPSPRGRSEGTGPAPATTVRVDHPAFDGPVTCTATDGKLEVRLSRDFSAADRTQLEEALRAFLDRLG